MRTVFIAFAFVLLSTAQEAAAQSSDLTITGRITPAPCSIELGNNGIADLGDILVKDLNVDKKTRLEEVTLPLSINCTTPTRFALGIVDNTESSPSPYASGLGFTPDDEKIGQARIGIRDYTADGVPCYITQSRDLGATWLSSGNLGDGELDLDRISGFNVVHNTRGPSPISVILTTLWVEATIQPTNVLTLDREVSINGSITISLVYL